MVNSGNKIPKKGEPEVKRALISILVSATMAIAPLPAMSAETGPLAPGGAAGVKEAQGGNNPPLLLWVGAGLAIALGILVLSNNNNSSAATTTTTGLPPQ
jgi:hypothetical protein